MDRLCVALPQGLGGPVLPAAGKRVPANEQLTTGPVREKRRSQSNGRSMNRGWGGAQAQRVENLIGSETHAATGSAPFIAGSKTMTRATRSAASSRPANPLVSPTTVS
jgi:hypothetical protein